MRPFIKYLTMWLYDTKYIYIKFSDHFVQHKSVQQLRKPTHHKVYFSSCSGAFDYFTWSSVYKPMWKNGNLNIPITGQTQSCVEDHEI